MNFELGSELSWGRCSLSLFFGGGGGGATGRFRRVLEEEVVAKIQKLSEEEQWMNLLKL